ncbi:MAG: hypothetical protein KAJ42_10305 [Gemmatimonadetes bacterium]|nr:hypothetical protein [Gemmatimonadota bacterium]
MPFIEYVPWKPRRDTMVVVDQAIVIINELVAKGFDLTLRQLYYQFVARGLLRNLQSEYKRLGTIIDRARNAGMIDWNTIVDRTRGVHSLSMWDDENQIVRGCAYSYRSDRWARQPCRFEVWVEKEALAGVFRRVCDELHIPLFSCRGYPSSSSVWRAARRLQSHMDAEQEVTILHFGDHDPSGIDMTRDIGKRQDLYDHSSSHPEEGFVGVERLALNMDQVERYTPPPNPAKMSDPRADEYIAEFGEESWELDALDPEVMEALVRDRVLDTRNEGLWQDAEDDDDESRRKLALLADHFDSAVSYLEDVQADQDREDDLE